jgi:F-type H+-transporting ATPase subunit c
MTRNLRTLLASMTVLLALAVPSLAFAEGGIAPEGQGWVALGSGLAIGLAAFGCGIGQGLAAFAALTGIARNPSAAGKIQTPMIIGLALIESLCIYALVIGFLLQGKIG